MDESAFDNLPEKDPYIIPSKDGEVIPEENVASPYGALDGNSSYVYKLSEMTPPSVPGGGGTLSKVDSRNFPIATTLAAAVVTLNPGAIRELHWHPNAEECKSQGQERLLPFLQSDSPTDWRL